MTTSVPETASVRDAHELRGSLPGAAPSLAIGLPVVGLFIVWAIHNGGYDQDTWYWGALAVLCLLVVAVAALRQRVRRPTPVSFAALALFALYVCWSYLSILWAQYQGAALQGSNRALLYLLVFTLMTILPWTVEAALVALLAFTVAIGVTAIVLLVHLASAANVSPLFVSGRLAAPTGYINATAALLMIAALPSIVLAARRELPGLLRGLLLAFATAELQLALTVQSRGWLFTLPLVLIVSIVLVPDRLRVTAAAILPALGAAVVARRMLHVYQDVPSDPLTQLAHHAAPDALMVCAGVFVVATLVAWADRLSKPRPVSRATGRTIGVGLTVVAVAAGCVVALIVSHGHVGHYVSHQWHGFAHRQTSATSSHFTDVGSGRYDFWRVSLHALRDHPLGGIGMDNFADYYIPRNHSGQNPSWPHSLEMRLLQMTGIVGFLLFVAFVVLGFVGVVQARRRGSPIARAVAAASTLPIVVWLIHGSIDWFWEMPALSGPALGFLGVACSLSAWRSERATKGPAGPIVASPGAPSDTRAANATDAVPGSAPPVRAHPVARAAAVAIGIVVVAAAAIVLVFPYLSVREVSIASDTQGSDPHAALHDYSVAAELNPLDADPDRLAGALALRTGAYRVALDRFKRSIERESGGWFEWLGAGLAASELDKHRLAHRDYKVAHRIFRQQPVIQEALRRIDGKHPLTAKQAFKHLALLP